MAYDFLQGRMRPDTPKEKRRSSPEADLGQAVDAYLKTLSIYIRTIKSEGTKMRNGRYRPSAQGTGISDRIGIIPPTGQFLAIELKAKGKKKTVTDTQFSFLMHIHSSGGVAILADCLEDVKTGLTSTREARFTVLQSFNPRLKPSKCSGEPLFP